MEMFRSFVHIMMYLDAFAFAVVFAVGAIVGPVIVLVDEARGWSYRLKWAAAAILGSWFGLWLYWLRRPVTGIRVLVRSMFDSK